MVSVIVMGVASGVQVENMRCEPGRGGDVIGDDLACNQTAGCEPWSLCEKTAGCTGWATISTPYEDLSYLRTNLDRSACFKEEVEIPCCRNIKPWRTNKYSFNLREDYGHEYADMYCHNGAGGVELDFDRDSWESVERCAYDPKCVAYVETDLSAYSFHAVFLSSLELSECEYDSNHQTRVHKFLDQTTDSLVSV